jgi:hypothetical protein
VLAHSEKEKAALTNKTFGFHPPAAFADHCAGAGGEPLAILLRAGNAGSNTAAEHIEVTRLALTQHPPPAAVDLLCDELVTSYRRGSWMGAVVDGAADAGEQGGLGEWFLQEVDLAGEGAVGVQDRLGVSGHV